MSLPIVDPFFLVGGTALALQLGHRFSVDEIFHIVKSLTYFEDAEQYADPIVFEKTVTWSKVKYSVREAVNNQIQ